MGLPGNPGCGPRLKISFPMIGPDFGRRQGPAQVAWAVAIAAKLRLWVLICACRTTMASAGYRSVEFNQPRQIMINQF